MYPIMRPVLTKMAFKRRTLHPGNAPRPSSLISRYAGGVCNRMIDDADCQWFATDELHACAAVNPSILTFGIELEKELTDTEKQILTHEPK